MGRSIRISQNAFALRSVFRISRGSRTAVEPLLLEIEEDGQIGRGECIPYARYGESVESVSAQIEAVRAQIEVRLGLDELQSTMTAGAARNAVDCALWDLQARLRGEPVWKLARLAPLKSVTTAFTLSIDEPEAMREAAAENAWRPLLKLKLAGDGNDLARVAAVHESAPQARLIVDANEAWNRKDYEALVPNLSNLGVDLIEQPFPAGEDSALAELPRPIKICADESCHTSEGLESLRSHYDVVNIKLDKSGGLSEALAMREEARKLGFEVMVGCMLGTSLGMAPATLVAQGAEYVDLDGPLLLAEDREPALSIEGSEIFPPPADLWGG